VEESTTRAPKISASLRIAVRFSEAGADAQQHHFARDRRLFGEVDGLQHVDQLVHLLDHLRRSCGSTSTTMVMLRQRRVERARDRQALDVVAARGEHAGARISAPGLFSTRRAMICSISWFSCAYLPPATGCGGRKHHFVDGGSGGHHRVDVLEGRHADVQQIRSGLVDRLFEGGAVARASRWCGP
jgi:hypothetical protein